MKGAGGGKRGGRKPARVELDDRPRGFEATRMRQLWRDIDHAKHKAGLGPVPEPVPAPLWDFAAVLGQAASLAAGAAGWVTANAPAAFALFASGAELLRAVPVVGRLVDLVPTPPAATRAGAHGGPAGRPNGHSRPAGDALPVAALPDAAPNDKWIH